MLFAVITLCAVLVGAGIVSAVSFSGSCIGALLQTSGSPRWSGVGRLAKILFTSER